MPFYRKHRSPRPVSSAGTDGSVGFFRVGSSRQVQEDASRREPVDEQVENDDATTAEEGRAQEVPPGRSQRYRGPEQGSSQDGRAPGVDVHHVGVRDGVGDEVVEVTVDRSPTRVYGGGHLALRERVARLRAVIGGVSTGSERRVRQQPGVTFFERKERVDALHATFEHTRRDVLQDRIRRLHCQFDFGAVRKTVSLYFLGHWWRLVREIAIV